jgi:hypothetical protein
MAYKFIGKNDVKNGKNTALNNFLISQKILK